MVAISPPQEDMMSFSRDAVETQTQGAKSVEGTKREWGEIALYNFTGELKLAAETETPN